MPQNPIQFQPGMSLNTFHERVGTEAQCEARRLAARWPSGLVCPACGHQAHSTFQADGRTD